MRQGAQRIGSGKATPGNGKAALIAARIDVYCVIVPDVLLLDLAGPMEVLRKANVEQPMTQFVVHYVGPGAASDSSIGLSLAGVQPLPDVLPDGAWVLVPGMADSALRTSAQHGAEAAPSERSSLRAEAEARIVAWLRRHVRPGIRLITICAGALLAARAGLLDGFRCTTHHASAAMLRQLAPAARVVDDRLFVEDGERLSSAGITTGVDLMLHLITVELGHQVALNIARYLVVWFRRSGSDPQLSPWLLGRNHAHPAIHRAQDAITRDPARDWSVRGLAQLAAVSERHLSRLFNEHAGLSVPEYLTRIRLAMAEDLLLQTSLAIEQVADRSGFGSARQFRRAWTGRHGRPPSRTRDRHGAG